MIYINSRWREGYFQSGLDFSATYWKYNISILCFCFCLVCIECLLYYCTWQKCSTTLIVSLCLPAAWCWADNTVVLPQKEIVYTKVQKCILNGMRGTKNEKWTLLKVKINRASDFASNNVTLFTLPTDNVYVHLKGIIWKLCTKTNIHIITKLVLFYPIPVLNSCFIFYKHKKSDLQIFKINSVLRVEKQAHIWIEHNIIPWLSCRSYSIKLAADCGLLGCGRVKLWWVRA